MAMACMASMAILGKIIQTAKKLWKGKDRVDSFHVR